MIAVFTREIKSYFKSPLAYVFLTFFLFMFGIYYSMINLFYANPDYSIVLSSITILLIIGIPIITMRLISEENKQKTDQLILTSPISVTEYIMAKYLAAVTLFTIMVLLTVLQPLLLSTIGPLPWQKIIGGYIGFYLLGITFIAIGLFLSSLTDNQVVSALTTFGALLLTIFLDAIGQTFPKDKNASITFTIIAIIAIAVLIYYITKNIYLSGIIGAAGIIAAIITYFIKSTFYDGLITKIIGWFSLFKRYDNFNIGIFQLADATYFLSVAAVFIFLTIQVIEKRRWS